MRCTPRELRRLIAAAVATLVAVQGAAFDVQSVDVDHRGDRYHVSMRVTLDAPAADTYAVFADPLRLRQVNPSIREVEVLEERGPGVRRIRTRVRACVALFCRHLGQVQDMRYQPANDGGRVDAQVLPDVSDFRHGQATWEFRGCEAGRTCLSFDAQLEPAFWIPPVVGPWLIERKLRDEAIETSRGLERLAGAHAVAR